MDYLDLLKKLYGNGFTRVERDDRLLDVFPDETREWGVELWEKWTADEVRLLRVRLPYDPDELKLYALARGQLEQLLQENTTAELGQFPTRDLRTLV